MTSTIVFHQQTLGSQAFQERVLRSAQALHATGLGSGDVLALLMRNSPQLLELMLAARWLGAMWCPINWHYRSDEVQFILHDCQAKVFVADAALLGDLAGLRLGTAATFVHRDRATGTATSASTPASRAIDTDTGKGTGTTVDALTEADAAAFTAQLPDWEQTRDGAAPYPAPALPPRGAMLYTSGTSGRPKGIARAPANAEQIAQGRAVLRQVLGLAPGMRALISAPMYHSAPSSYCVGAALEDDATLFIEPRFDAQDTLRMIEQHRITHAYLVPTMYVRLLALPAAVRARYDLRSMRFVASTGSPCAPEVKRAMIEWWGPVIHEAYGSSELGYMTLLDSADALRKPGSAGRPLPGVQMAILGPRGQPLAPAQAGLIHAHQPAYADFTYVGNDAARRQMEHGGLKTMGDIGYLDDEGFLYIVDRASDMVISGGVNIYPAEIEAVLQQMPGVADCAVFGIPDAEFGESLAAVVQMQAHASASEGDVIAYLRPHLAGYKLPRLVRFATELPREDTGKIFKRKLREPYWVDKQRRV